MPQYFGKYRGTVVNNIDPMQIGRLQVMVPDVMGVSLSSWAMPCVPLTGPQMGSFFLPMIGSGVWVEFEGGNPESAIWSGCFWGIGEFPPAMALPQIKTFKTDTATVTLSDLPGIGGITIETKDGKKIKIDATSIEIDNGAKGTVKLMGPKVSINGTALEVT